MAFAIEEHDRGFGYDLSIMSRRRMLLGLGAASLTAVAACSTAGSDTGADIPAATAEALAEAAPQETNGPYPGDGSNGPNVLIESGIVRSDITTSFGSYNGVAQGVPATLTITLQDLAKKGAPAPGWPFTSGSATARAGTRSTARA